MSTRSAFRALAVRLFSLMLGLLFGAASASPAHAWNPDPELEARLHQQLRDAHFARVGISGKTYVLVKPRVTADGLAFDRIEGATRPALITDASWDSAVPASPIPWSSIGQMESGRRTRLPSALIGGGIGMLSGLVVGGFLGYVAEMEGNGDQTEIMLGTTVFSTGLGLAVGAAFPRTRWVRFQPDGAP